MTSATSTAGISRSSTATPTSLFRGTPRGWTQIVAELVRLKPAGLVVSVTEAALAAKKATSAIPIVMVSVSDPVAAGLVSSLGRPGGNVTGLTRQTPDLIGKNLQLLKEALTHATVIGVLANSTEPLRSVMVEEVKEAATSLWSKGQPRGGAPTD